MPIKILEAPDSPWGDYGTIAVHGMSAHHAPDDTDSLHLERSGTFVPPITFPGIGTIVVTDAFRRRLDTAGFEGLVFRPVRKARIVDLEWRHWIPDGDPAELPDSGEPEDLLLERPHNESLAQALGDLWELVLPVGAQIERVQHGPYSRDVDIVLLSATWSGADLFRANGVLYNYASERAQRWLTEEASEWVSFRDCPIR